VDKLSAAIEKAAKSPEFAETLAKYFAQPFYRNAADTVKEDKAEVEQLKQLFK
jgi:tripartite-type tricarboxylate transporter receptor subunit TctC